jgi:hypothetical protein
MPRHWPSTSRPFPTRPSSRSIAAPSSTFSGALHCIVKHQPAPTFRLTVDQPAPTACAPETGTDEFAIEVALQGINGFSDVVTLISSGEPTGVISQFSPGSLVAPAEAIWTLTVDASASPGTTEISLIGDDGVGSELSVSLSLTLEAPLSGPGLVNPPDLAEEVALQPELEWNGLAGGAQYRIQLALDPDFEHILTDELVDSTLLAINQELDSDKLHYWRVQAQNACGGGAWSETRQFRTRSHPVVGITPDELLFEVTQNDVDSRALVIDNVGSGELHWTLETEACSGGQDVPWLGVDTVSGSSGAGQSSAVEVSVDATGLPPGLFEGALCLTTNEVDAEPLTVPVILEVLNLPPGEVAVAPTLLNFGAVGNGVAVTISVTVSNVAETGHADLVIGQIGVIAGQSVFSVTSCDCGQYLAPQTSCQVEVQFLPENTTAYSGVLRIVVDGQSVNASLQGDGIEPQAGIFRDRFQPDPDG